MEIEKVKEAIAAFERIKTVDETGYQAAMQVFKSVGKLPALIDSMDTGTRMLRTRSHIDSVLYTKIQEIAAPPKKVLKGFGRCNKPYSPIFYCSEDRPTSFLELLDSWSDELDHQAPIYATIGAWYTKRPMNFLIIPSPDAHDRHTNFDKRYGDAIDHEFAKLDQNVREAYMLYYRYLVGKLRQDGKKSKLPYIITSAYFDFVMDEAEKRKGQDGYIRLDGIMYPSVQRKGEAMNFAIRPEIITPANFHLKTVYREAFKRIDNPPFIPNFTQIEQIEASKVDQIEGEILWCSSSNKVLQAQFNPNRKYSIIAR